MRITIAIAVLHLAATMPVRARGSVATADDLTGAGRAIGSYAAVLEERGDLSGALLVAKGDNILFDRAFGMASYELGVANTLSTRFNVASISKPLTTIVVLRLVDEGVIRLDDPLSNWLPLFPRAEEITIDHLLRHRSGLPHRVTEPSQETVPRSAADMARLAADVDLLFDPGSGRSYSSSGYSVLARLLELATGLSYGDLLQSLVFGPVGADHSLHSDRRTPTPDRAESFFRGPDGPLNAPLRDLSFLVGAGSVLSTTGDLMKVVRGVVDGTYGEAIRAEMLDEEGLQWSGLTNGFRAFLDYRLDHDLTVVFTGNLWTGAADLLRADVPRIVLGERVALPDLPAIVAVPLTPPQRLGVEGTYDIRPGVRVELRFEPDGRLATLGDWSLIPLGPTTFFSPQGYSRVEALLGDDGVATALRWGDPGPEFPRVAPLVPMPTLRRRCDYSAPSSRDGSWSPDGSTIVFSSNRGGDFQIYSMRNGGSNARQLTDTGLPSYLPSVSPDGTMITFMTYGDDEKAIYVMELDGSDLTRLTDPAHANLDPSWSPDGTRIVFSSERNGNAEIHVMGVDGRQLTRLTDHPAADGAPKWSPDGSEILFVSDRDGHSELYLMAENGSDVRRLARHDGSGLVPSWAPDGRRVVYYSGPRRESFSPPVTLSEWRSLAEIMSIAADGTDVRRLTRNRFLDQGPVYSPDGSRILFTSCRSGSRELWFMDADGSDAERVTFSEGKAPE